MYRYIILLLALIHGSATAHEFTPTYPSMQQSYVQGILYTTMTLFNVRDDVEYYELGVFDKDWGKVPFATANKLLSIKHLEKIDVDIFIRNIDINRAVYICSKSKILVQGESKTSLESRICSKIK